MINLFLYTLFPSFILQYFLSTRKQRIWAIILPVLMFLSGLYNYFLLYVYMESLLTKFLSLLLLLSPTIILIGIYFIARKFSGLPLGKG